ncbi:uncharacterized protein LOC124932974 [Impatiens glandulifera]|uniref:uncharacterized protein LOC124932974 n=1 Tax=Impatiens glandulifera TaxID=253017 RepID=UPI001FB18BAE|nr:uncharacterized protein LOC124932974 [Impatiens glandulifera]
MAEFNSPRYRSGAAEKEIKETLYAQQKLLKNISNDLEVEREAASSAASEALSMILKLQGEKAALMMEANQYKRLAEEKMCHAEEAIAIFEDIIYQKEMEIVSLEYQLQAYRYKLVSMGCNDIGVYESSFPEHLLQRNDRSGDNIGGDQGSLRRNSMPTFSSFKSFDQKRVLNDSSDLIPEIEEELEIFKDADDSVDDGENKSMDDVMVGNDMNMYWDQIQKLNQRLKGITGWGGDNPFASNSKGDQEQEQDQEQDHNRGKEQEQDHNWGKEREQEEERKEQPVSSVLRSISLAPIITNHKRTSPSKVHDVFEVPQSEGNEIPRTTGPLARMATENVKKMMNLHTGKRLLTRPTDISMLASDHPYSIEIGESQTSIQPPIRPTKVKGCKKCGHLGDFGGLMILKDIQEKVNSIQLDIRTLKDDHQNNRSSSSSTRSHDQPNLNNLSELMLHFWL